MGKMIEIEDEKTKFPAYLAQPDSAPKGGVIVIHEVWGLNEHTKDIADRFAAEGYLSLAPDLLSEVGITAELVGDLQKELFDPERRSQAQPKLRELMAPLSAPGFAERTVNHLKACFEKLSSLEGAAGKVAVVGYCFGGSYSFSLAVHEPKLKAAIPYYGHADFSADQLSNIRCPVLAFYGEDDERLIEGLDELKDKMSQAGVDFTAQVYEGCGHAFFNDTNPYTYNETAAQDSWERTLKLLNDNL